MSTPLTSANPAALADSGSVADGSGRAAWVTDSIETTGWLNGLSPAGATVYDTGWISGSLDGAYTGSVSYRRWGMFVEIRVATTAGTIATGASVLATAVIPAAYRSVGSNPRAVAFTSSNTNASVYMESSTGNVGVVNDTGSTRTSLQARILYLLG